MSPFTEESLPSVTDFDYLPLTDTLLPTNFGQSRERWSAEHLCVLCEVSAASAVEIFALSSRRDVKKEIRVASCAQCGNALAPADRFCAVCGRVVLAFSPTSAPGVVPLAPGIPPPTSGKAIASLICGIFFFMLPASIAAVVLGHLSLSDIKKSAGRIQGQGLATAGLVLGYLGLAFIPLAIIAAIAIPNLLRARIGANEAVAISSIRSIVAAEVDYQQEHPEIGFTCDLNELSSVGKIDSSLATGTKTGYTFSLQNCSMGESGTQMQKYQIVASPVRRNQTGIRTFCSDESAVIKAHSSGSPEACFANGQTL
jgi:type IV pilus assembly protein PilA